jgi:hypothetical protein
MAAWLLSFPLMVAGSQVAHVLAYRWVYPQAHVRWGELLATGHSYMGSPMYAPMLLGFVFAAELIGLGGAVAGGVRGGPRKPVPAVAFALLPLIGFTLQEFLERWLSGASFPWWVVLQPAFRAGLLLQLPFALAAYLVARFLLRSGERMGRALRFATAQTAPTGVLRGWVVRRMPPRPRRGALAGGHAGRGPPQPVSAAIGR